MTDMTATAKPVHTAAATHRAGIGTMLKIGARELRSGLSGFYVFIACLALGVMVIAAVGALGDELADGV